MSDDTFTFSTKNIELFKGIVDYAKRFGEQNSNRNYSQNITTAELKKHNGCLDEAQIPINTEPKMCCATKTNVEKVKYVAEKVAEINGGEVTNGAIRQYIEKFLSKDDNFDGLRGTKHTACVSINLNKLCSKGILKKTDNTSTRNAKYFFPKKQKE